MADETTHWTRQTTEEQQQQQREGGNSSYLFSSASSSSASASAAVDDDSYDYDYAESTGSLPVAEFVSVTLVYGLTFILGAAGNTLVIVCIARFRRMQSVTNIFLVSLASADLLLVFACVPIKFAKWFTFTWNFGEVLCKVVHYLQNTSVICSVLTLTTMSLERYYAILEPMQARYMYTSRRAKRMVVLLWIASFVLALPIFYCQTLKKVGVVRTGYWCVKEWQDPLHEKLFELGMFLLILVIPLMAMTFAYASICLELWTVLSRRRFLRAPRSLETSRNAHTTTVLQHCNNVQVPQLNFSSEERMTSSDRLSVFRHVRQTNDLQNGDDRRTSKQVIKMLVAIVVLFAVCWTPTILDNVLVAFGVVDRLHYGQLKHLRQAFALMSYANSCVNPIVYAFMSKNFRAGFRQTLCACARRRSGGGGGNGGRESSRMRTVAAAGAAARSPRTTPDGISVVYSRTPAAAAATEAEAQTTRLTGQRKGRRDHRRQANRDHVDASQQWQQI